MTYGALRVKFSLKLANYLVLLLLNYSNASIALPQAFGNPDADFLVFIYSTTFVLCAAAYSIAGCSGPMMNVGERTNEQFV